MWFAPLLKMRDKISRKRKQMAFDEEKPFLEHLEDLRKMLMRMITTLVIAVMLCFVFDEYFFEIIKAPVREAGLSSAREKSLPEGVSQAEWTVIHGAARGAAVLQGAQREEFLKIAVPDNRLRHYAEGLLLYHAADGMERERRDLFLQAASATLPPDRAGEVLKATRAILEAKPSPSLEPLKPVIEMEAFGPPEVFMLSMKLSLFAGIIVSFPLLFYFLMEFILPGLTDREKRMLWPALAVGFGLFLSGVFFAYNFVVPQALEYFHEFSEARGIASGWRIGTYISFVTQFCLIFGLSFELPVVVMTLVKLGLLESGTMRRTRSWAVLIIVVVGAILTPTGDLLTLSVLCGPMIVMYEICIWLAVMIERKAAREEELERERDMARRAALVGVATVPAAGYDSTHDSGETSGDYGHGPANPYGHLTDSSESSGSHSPEETAAGEDATPEKSAADLEYEQYMKEHAHLFPTAQTHSEMIPVEEREKAEAPAPSTPPATPEAGAPKEEKPETDSPSAPPPAGS